MPKGRKYDQELLDRGAQLAWRVKERVPFCWMCRATTGQRAKEHIFPVWLQKELNAAGETWSPTHMDYLGREISVRGPHTTSGLLAGEVCRRCNGGWMNDLEAKFRSVMFPRIATIDEESGAVIAQWFAKTATVLNTAQNYRLMIPRGTRHAIKHGVPRHMGVYLGRMSDPPDQLAFAQQAGQVIGVVQTDLLDRGLELISQAYVCVIRVVDVVAAVVYAAPDVWAKPCHEMAQLHPWAGESLRWDELPAVDEIWEPLTLCGDHPAVAPTPS